MITDKEWWLDFISQWEQRLSVKMGQSCKISFPGAEFDEIERVQEDLGIMLPQTFLDFMFASNGLIVPNMDGEDGALLPLGELTWFRSVSLLPIESNFDADDCKYEKCSPWEIFSASNAKSAILISKQIDSACYLLIPRVSTGGEFEAWAIFNRGESMKFRDFSQLMIYERERTLAKALM